MTEQEQQQQYLMNINHQAGLIAEIADNNLPVTAKSDGDKITISTVIKEPDMTKREFVDVPQILDVSMLNTIEEAANNSIAQGRKQVEIAKKLLDDLEIVRLKMKAARAAVIDQPL